VINYNAKVQYDLSYVQNVLISKCSAPGREDGHSKRELGCESGYNPHRSCEVASVVN